jgi:hypothetical protein
MNDDTLCRFCWGFGVIAPWALLLLGAVLGVWPGTHPLVDRISAYTTALGLLVFTGSYLLSHYGNGLLVKR